VLSRPLRSAGRSLLPIRYRAALRQIYNRATTPADRVAGSFQPAGDGTVAVRLSSGETFRIADDSRADVECHVRDPRQAAELAAFLRLSASRSPGLLFDVGAHSGLFSLAHCLVNPENRAVAFEPAAALTARIEQHGRLNGIATRQAVVCKAVADSAGSREMFAGDGDGYVQAARFAGTEGRGWRACRLETTTLDAEMARCGAPSLVKIDVEGYEREVLEGAGAVLSASRPVVLLELHLNFLEERRIAPSSVLALLDAHGYELSTLDGTPLSAARASRSWANVLHLVAAPA
jgi:FkbM family methyltransferase